MHAFVLKVKTATIEIVHGANHFNALFKSQNNPIEHKLAQKCNICHRTVIRIYSSGNLISGQCLGRSLVRLEIKHGYKTKLL